MERVNKSLVDMTTCTICQEMYRKPRQLPCQHVYCTKCLHKIISNAQEIHQPDIECPLCRHRVLIPIKGVDGFPVSLVIVNLCDTVIMLSKEPEHNTSTSDAEELRDWERLKKELQDYVDKFKNSKKELSNTKTSFNDKCDQIENATKERASLLHSAVDNHMQHIVNKVNEVRGEINFKLDSETTRISIEEQQVLDSLQMLEDNTNVSGNLIASAKTVLSALRTTVNTAVPKLNVHFSQEPEKISKTFGYFSCSDRSYPVDEIDAIDLNVAGATGGTDDHQANKGKVSLSKRLSDENCSSPVLPHLERNLLQRSGSSASDQSGSNRRVSEFKMPYNPQSMTVTDEGDLVTLTSSSNVDIWSNGFQVSVKVPNAGQIVFHQGDLIVTDSVNSGFHIRKKDCFHKHYISVPELYPFAVCSTYNGVLVTSCKQKELYKLELDHNNHLVKHQVLLREGTIRFPEYVATNQRVTAVTCSCTNTVIGLEPNGRLKFVYGSGQGPNDGQLNNPKGVCIASDGNIYVADSRNHRVVTLSSSGELVNYFVNHSDNVYYPQLVAIHNGNLYVSHTDEVYKSWTVSVFQLP